MKRSECTDYEGSSVRITYKNRAGTQIRAGVAKAIGLRVLMFWPLDYDDETDSEILIKYPDIEDIEPLN